MVHYIEYNVNFNQGQSFKTVTMSYELLRTAVGHFHVKYPPSTLRLDDNQCGETALLSEISKVALPEAN